MKARLVKIREAADPERLTELDRAKAELERLNLGASDWERIARWRDDSGLRMDSVSIDPAGAESDDPIAFSESGLLPVRRVTSTELPRVLAEWLSRLHVDLVAYPDRIANNGQIDFDVPIGEDEHPPREASHSGRGLG